ncbi:PQQ-dependent sugar dehydrogenase [Actinoplanes sp. CA-252034]|uniref:PQQ-dependent sugar dehydrogenase n=1 Tax=Actinoplanes sp. CA-252034 TaxID=3239906 RepID=UPI003D9877B2
MRTIAHGVMTASLVLALAGCTAMEEAPGPERSTVPATGAARVPELTASAVRTLDGTGAAPFDSERTVQAPPGWTVTVWARIDSARLLAWTPDRQLLVSRPKFGDVIALTPGADGSAPAQRTLLSGLNQPHGLAFAGDTLYVAESDQINSYAYRNGQVTGRKIVVDGLPDDKSPDLRGAYSHALKSVAIGKDGSIYVSVGSTGNISVQDRDATPQRATILRAPAGGGTPTVYARGVRNGTGLAVDPDGAVWTAVNHRDNIQYPHERDYDGDGTKDNGDVIQAYVNDHPMEQLARLTEGRELGWPYCNSEADVNPGAPDSPLSYSGRPFVLDLETNVDGSKLDCAKLPPVEQGMGAHSAPLGLSFVTGPGLAGGTAPARSSASTARGTATRRAPRRCRSSPGATARSARSRL